MTHGWCDAETDFHKCAQTREVLFTFSVGCSRLPSAVNDLTATKKKNMNSTSFHSTAHEVLQEEEEDECLKPMRRDWFSSSPDSRWSRFMIETAWKSDRNFIGAFLFFSKRRNAVSLLEQSTKRRPQQETSKKPGLTHHLVHLMSPRPGTGRRSNNETVNARTAEQARARRSTS